MEFERISNKNYGLEFRRNDARRRVRGSRQKEREKSPQTK